MARPRPPRLLPLTVPQADYLSRPEPFVGFVGGIGSGKSFVLCYDLIRRARPGCLYMVAAPSFPMLRDTTLRSFFDVVARLGQRVHFRRTESVAVLPHTGAEIMFRSADDPERMRGPNLSGIGLDEASLMPKEVFQICIGRLRQGGRLGFLRAAMTPKGKKHWTYEVFGKGGPDTALVQCPTAANPFLPDQFVETVRRQYPTALAAQELGGEFVDPEGGLYRTAWFGTFAFVGGDGYRVGGRFHRRADCVHFGIVDPAVGKGAGSDPVGFGAFAATPDADLLCLYLASERLPLEAIVPRLVRLDRDHGFDFLGCEANGFQVGVAREARAALDCPVVELSPRGKGKVVRSYPAIIEAEQGHVYVPEGAPAWVEPALSELSCWTGADKEPDEVPDVLAYAVALRDRHPAPGALPESLEDADAPAVVGGVAGPGGGLY